MIIKLDGIDIIQKKNVTIETKLWPKIDGFLFDTNYQKKKKKKEENAN